MSYSDGSLGSYSFSETADRDGKFYCVFVKAKHFPRFKTPYDLVFNLQCGVLLHGLEETLLPTGGQGECEVAVRRLGEGGQRRESVPHQRHKHGQHTQQQPGGLHGQTARPDVQQSQPLLQLLES